MRQHKKILLAEAEPQIAEILPQFLKPLGYNVINCADGNTALELARRERPDLIITDATLPHLDGMALSKLLKTDFLTSYIPIIILIEKRQFRKQILDIEQGMDDYLLKPPDPIDLEVRIQMALRRTEHQVHANSLTKLPGNRAIERILKIKIAESKPFSFIYFDVDNFKSFNDKYGYIKGDEVIIQTGRIIIGAVRKFGNADDFVGHVGGDDFVVVTTPDKEEEISQNAIFEFDRLIPYQYSEKDRKLKYLVVKDRSGKIIKAPLMSVSVAIVNNNNRKIASVVELTEVAFEIKKYLKSIRGSKFLVNRRTDNLGIKRRTSKTSHKQLKCREEKQGIQKPPLGQMLLDAHLISENQLQEALQEHWQTGEPLGQTLLRMQFLSSSDLNKFITTQ
jgi:diguanylate cyclase (GGDEF)-like protein